MDREGALSLIQQYVKNRNIVKHMLAVEAIMRMLAERLGEDADEWGLTGLLHDLDYELSGKDMAKHGLLTEEMLASEIDEKIVRAVKAHNEEGTGVVPESRIEKMLISADAISGLIIACALVMPSRKLSEVGVKTITKKFKDKDFARGSDRERILVCESAGLAKEDLFEIALNALQGISGELGL